jgi:hypothetical protein
MIFHELAVKTSDPEWAELYCRIIYRRATHSWRVVGHIKYDPYERDVCGFGSLRRARRKAREWLREHSDETPFEKVML